MSLQDLFIRKNQIEMQLDELEAQIRPAMAPLKVELAEVEQGIHALTTAALASEKTPDQTGTINFKVDGVGVKAVIRKDVSWDQLKLLEIRAKIAAAGDNPAEYIEEKLSVPEKKYSAWPEGIKKVFEPARTVKPGTPKFEFNLDDLPPF